MEYKKPGIFPIVCYVGNAILFLFGLFLLTLSILAVLTAGGGEPWEGLAIFFLVIIMGGWGLFSLALAIAFFFIIKEIKKNKNWARILGAILLGISIIMPLLLLYIILRMQGFIQAPFPF